jgi:hypothetical protein
MGTVPMPGFFRGRILILHGENSINKMPELADLCEGGKG